VSDGPTPRCAASVQRRGPAQWSSLFKHMFARLAATSRAKRDAIGNRRTRARFAGDPRRLKSISDQWPVEGTDLPSLQIWSRASPGSRIEVFSHLRRFRLGGGWPRRHLGRSVGRILRGATCRHGQRNHEDGSERSRVLAEGVQPTHAAADTPRAGKAFPPDMSDDQTISNRRFLREVGGPDRPKVVLSLGRIRRA
jgi:hypothetical protein